MALTSSTSGQRLGTSTAFKGFRPRPCIARTSVSRCTRQSLVVRAGLFDFLTPKSAAPAVNPRAKEISEELIDICSGTAVGSRATPAVKEQIEELVSDLAQYSIKNPLRSPLLWGTYEVLYCSKPTAVGGPLKKGAGPVLAPGQVARQILEEPDTLINEVTFKTFGFIPGVSKQYGNIRPVSGDTFVLTIRDGELNAGIVNQQKEFDISRKIQILYLDETLRIARFLPSGELADQEAEEAQGGPESEEILFVFQRVAEEEAEEEEEEEPEPEEERAASPVLGLFGGGGTRKVESLATQVERQVESQRTRRGTQAFFVGGRGRQQEEEEEEADDPRAAKQRERAAAQARKQREQDERRAAADRARQEAAAAKAAEQARAQKERDAAAKAKAAQEARERAEAEKAERAARAAAIREQLADLAEELKEKQTAAREAQKEAREVARENQSVLKQVQAAEKAIADAEQEVQEVSSALEEAVDVRKSAEADVKQAQQAVKQAETAYKQKVAAR